MRGSAEIADLETEVEDLKTENLPEIQKNRDVREWPR
jgi:hypothetical protein